ncbi:hypothetical protein [Flavobacterium anhuiense]|nr:hypothetical protein [Flavobacterium anhuiense]
MKLRTFKALLKAAGGKVRVDFKNSSWSDDGNEASAQYMTLRESKGEIYTGSDDGFINVVRNIATDLGRPRTMEQYNGRFVPYKIHYINPTITIK